MAGQLDEISAAIGGLQAEARSVSTSLREERENAAKHRRDLRDVIASLSQSVRTLAVEVGEMKPEWDDYRTKRAEARGAIKMARFFWAGIVMMGGVVGGAAVEIVRLMLQR